MSRPTHKEFCNLCKCGIPNTKKAWLEHLQGKRHLSNSENISDSDQNIQGQVPDQIIEEDGEDSGENKDQHEFTPNWPDMDLEDDNWNDWEYKKKKKKRDLGKRNSPVSVILPKKEKKFWKDHNVKGHATNDWNKNKKDPKDSNFHIFRILHPGKIKITQEEIDQQKTDAELSIMASLRDKKGTGSNAASANPDAPINLQGLSNKQRKRLLKQQRKNKNQQNFLPDDEAEYLYKSDEEFDANIF